MTSDVPAEHQLPDDVDRWPTDPHQLLGVPPDVSRRELKRSYTRLIRRFKPEHFPEQFRRLRDAFDEIDRQLEFFEQFQIQVRLNDLPPGEEEPPTKIACPSAETVSGPSSPTEETDSPFDVAKPAPAEAADGDTALMPSATRRINVDPAGRQGFSNNSDQLWQQALDGDDLELVYSQLTKIVGGKRAKETDFARLYWLLSICPELNAEKVPCQWLLEGIRLHGCRNQLPHMLSAEIRRKPSDVSSMLAQDLFDAKLSPDDIVGLAELRWIVARRLGRFDVIQSDLEALETLFFETPTEWQRLLFTAIRQLVFLPNMPALVLLDSVCKKIGQTPATVSSNWLWDAFDVVMVLHNYWVNRAKTLIGPVVTLQTMNLSGQLKLMEVNQTNRAQATLVMLLNLIEATWECTPLQAKSELLSACSQLTNYPLTTLNELAIIARVAGPVACRFLELIREQKDEFVDDSLYKLTPAVERRIVEFVFRELWQFETWEASVLNFCLNEAVSPNEVADVIEGCQEKLPDSSLIIAQAIRNDLPIACVVEAQRLLW